MHGQSCMGPTQQSRSIDRSTVTCGPPYLSEALWYSNTAWLTARVGKYIRFCPSIRVYTATYTNTCIIHVFCISLISPTVRTCKIQHCMVHFIRAWCAQLLYTCIVYSVNSAIPVYNCTNTNTENTFVCVFSSSAWVDTNALKDPCSVGIRTCTLYSCTHTVHVPVLVRLSYILLS